MNRTAYRVLLGEENLKIQSSDDENLVLKSKKRMFWKMQILTQKTGVDTPENLSKFPMASFETPRSVMHTAQTEEGKVHTIQLKHPARLADAAV